MPLLPLSALLLSLALGDIGAVATAEYVGQVVCSECWFEAGDRMSDPYGTPSDLACAARCAGEGIPPALAVRSGDAFELMLLEGDRDWLPWMGRFARIGGETAQGDGKRILRVESITPLEENPWSPATAVATTTEPLGWTDLGGHRQELRSYRGRVVVLNFWATWCAPCLEEMPELVRIQNKYGMYGVQVLGAAADPAAEASSVLGYARRLELNFPILLGARTDQMQALGAGVALPATVVIDRQGRVVERIAGIFKRSRLEALLDRLIRQDTAAAVEDAAPLVASADPHGHGDHDHDKPHGGTEASLVPS